MKKDETKKIEKKIHKHRRHHPRREQTLNSFCVTVKVKKNKTMKLSILARDIADAVRIVERTIKMPVMAIECLKA